MSDTEAQFVDVCALSRSDMKELSGGKAIKNIKIPVSDVSVKETQKVEPMLFWNHLACLLFLALGVPSGVFTIPPLVLFVGWFVVGNVQATFLVFGALMLPLIILPQPFVPDSLNSWMAVQVIKYFSFRFVAEELFYEERARILVAPPHGVFPYGNLLCIATYPKIVGYNMRALASSAALRVPIFKQILRSIGVVDASREVTRTLLQQGHTVGISTGGVAEVFHTNNEDECILLKERKGMVKLAIRTGAELVPCYVFGNTKLLGCWAGEGLPLWARHSLETISRKIGFATILFFGRFGLPIPYRVPVLAVMGKPIVTNHIKCEEPTLEQINEIHATLLKDMNTLFDKYKGLYGWEEKHLVIV